MGQQRAQKKAIVMGLAKNVRKPEDLHNQALHALFMSCLIHTQCRGHASLLGTRHPSVEKELKWPSQTCICIPRRAGAENFQIHGTHNLGKDYEKQSHNHSDAGGIISWARTEGQASAPRDTCFIPPISPARDAGEWPPIQSG